MNNTIIIGRLTKDPEGRSTNTGKFTCSFTVAVDRKFKRDGQPTADFFRVVAWDNGEAGKGTASFVTQYLKKGNRVAVHGTMQERQYDKDGQTVRLWELIASDVQGLESRASSNEQQSAGNSGASQGNTAQSSAPDVQDPFADE